MLLIPITVNGDCWVNVPDGWRTPSPASSPIPVHHVPSQSKAHGVQKKAYRVLEEVCASPQGPGARFVQSHLDDLKKTLLDSLRSTSSPAKRVRTPGQPRSAWGRMGDTRRGPLWRQLGAFRGRRSIEGS